MRCLIEVLTENMRYSEAIKRIDEAKQIFSGETDLWEIYDIIGNTDEALVRMKRILEVYLSDYGIENGSEVDVWKMEEERLTEKQEYEQLTIE